MITPTSAATAGVDPASPGDIRAEDLRPILNRLRRAEGQLAAVIRMLEAGQDCSQVLPQLSAVSKALSKAGFAIVASNLQECLAHPDATQGADLAKLEKLFMSLA